jgi:uncharacterized membrane protein YphA (DoxX/SURF4 family)
LGVPAPEFVGWLVGLVETASGLALIIGLLVRLVAAFNLLQLVGLLVIGLLRGGIPPALPGLEYFPYQLPGYQVSLLTIGGLAALLIGGAGLYSVDRLWAARRGPIPPPAPEDVWLVNRWAPLPIRLIYAIYLIGVGAPVFFLRPGHTAVADALAGLGLPLAGLLAWLLGLIEFGGGLALLLGAYTPLAAGLNAAAVGLLLLLALVAGRFPEPFPGVPLLPDYGRALLLLAGLLALLLGGAGGFSVDAMRERRKQRMRPLTVLAKIKPGQEEPLRQLLVAINSDIAGNPYIRFGEDECTHFARWFIFTTPEVGPRLAFVATYNGDLAAYVANLVRVSPGLDEIWGKCEEYAGKASFLDFVRSHAVPSPYWFTAYPYETVPTIRNKIAIRQEIEAYFDSDTVANWLRCPGPESSLGSPLGPFLARLAQTATPATVLQRLDNWLTALGPRVAAYLRSVLVPVALRLTRVYAEYQEPKEFPRLLDIYTDTAQRRQYLAHAQALEENKSSYEQNQLTVLAPIRPDRLFRLRLALFLGGYLAGYGYPPGELTGVFTIHFLHWVIFDEGKYGFVLSNYDGSWENYLGDFADKLNFGLDALFNNCKNYPPGGLSRVEAWSQWIRTAQLVVPLYYSAYPTETALHLTRDRAISQAFGNAYARNAASPALL